MLFHRALTSALTVAATTKMREIIPAEYEEKLLKYKTIGAKMIAEYNIPPELVINCDETNSLFAPLKNKTRAKRGELI